MLACCLAVATHADETPELLPPTTSEPPAASSATPPADGATISDLPGEPKLIDLEADSKVTINLDDCLPLRPRGSIWPQKSSGYSYIPRTGDSGFGIQDIEFPATAGESKSEQEDGGGDNIHGSLGFGIHLFDGPGPFPAPPQAFDLYFELAYIRTLGNRWSVELATAPGIYSDFANGDDDRFRIPSRALAAYEASTGVKWVVGLLYLDWGTLKVLPVGGLIFQPHDLVRYELVAPRPRITWRRSSDSELWWHAGVEYFGNSWGVERSETFNDQLTYSDFRATLGWQVCDSESGYFCDLEIGYVFSRELEYRSDRASFYPNDAMMLSWTVGY